MEPRQTKNNNLRVNSAEMAHKKQLELIARYKRDRWRPPTNDLPFITNIVTTAFTDAPVDFSSDDIDNPEIVYLEDEQQVPVTLLCKFKILRGIETWKNVTYKIEWFVDGNLAKKPTIICKPVSGSKENQDPCPDHNPVMTELSGKSNDGTGHYQAGQTVSWI